MNDTRNHIGADVPQAASWAPLRQGPASRAGRPGTGSTGAGIRLASLVATLLFYLPSAAADLLQDLLRKGVDAATQEMKRQESRPATVPAAPAPPAAPGPAPDAARTAPQAAQPTVAKQPAPHPDEVNFVAPSATTRLSETERCFSLVREEISGAKARCPLHKPVENAELMRGEPRASYPSEFLTFRNSPRMIVDNPYLSLDRGFFNKIRGASCDPAGGLWVTSTAWLKRNNNPYASGIWRIAPDGQITALAAKPWALETSRRYPYCNAPFQKSGLEVSNLTRLTPAADGSMLAISSDPTYSAISRIMADGSIEYIAGGGPCAAAAARSDGYADGSVGVAKFKAILAVLEDPQKNIWVGDAGNCALRKIAGGQVTTVVPPERACPKLDPENHLVFDHFAWDPKSGELIAAGTYLYRGPPRDYFSSIWRISADGAMKRLYLSQAEGRGPNSGFGVIEGLAVDHAGAIWFAQSYFGTKEGTKIMRIGADAKLVQIAGPPLPGNVNHGDGPAREALFASMSSMCFDSQDTLFMYGDNMIRKMTRDGRVTTWAY